MITLFAAMIATAAPAALANGPTAPAATQAPRTDSAAAPRERLYCIKYMITGSILTNKKCRTEAEWRDRGVDVHEKQ